MKFVTDPVLPVNKTYNLIIQVGNYSSNIIKESSSMGAPMSVLVTNKQVMNFEPL